MINLEWTDTDRNNYNCWSRKHLSYDTNIYNWIYILQT